MPEILSGKRVSTLLESPLESQTTQPPTKKNSPTQDASQKYPFSKKWITIELALLLVIIALSTSYAIYLYSRNNKHASFAKPTPVIPSPTPTLIQQASKNQLTNDVLADWKTYTNEKYGYKINYPSIVNPNIYDSTKTMAIIFSLYFEDTRNYCHAANGCGWSVTIFKPYNNTTQLSLTEWAKENKITSGTGNQDDTIVNDTRISNEPVIAWKTYFENTQSEFQSEPPSKFLVQHGAYIFYIEAGAFGTDGPEKQVNQEIVDQILSTFKFLD